MGKSSDSASEPRHRGSTAEPQLVRDALEASLGLRTPVQVAFSFVADLCKVSSEYARAFSTFLERRRRRELGALTTARADTDIHLETVGEGAAGTASAGPPAPAPDSPSERARAEADLRRLLAVRGRERLSVFDSSRRRMRSPILVERLVEEACDLRPHDPHEALDLVEVAARVARRVPAASAGKARKHSLLIRVEAHRANVLRVLGDLVAADELWCSIRAHLLRHPIEPPAEEAEILSLEGSLRIDLRQLDEADRLLERAERLYRRVGDPERRAAVLIQRAKVSYLAGSADDHLARLVEAQELLERARSPKLLLIVQHDLAVSLVDLGRLDEAEVALSKNLPLYAQRADPALRIQLSWLQGRIARARGRSAEAERHLREARNGFLAQRLVYDVALVSLDLAELYHSTGETAKVKELARLLAPIFAGQRVHREAMAALVLFEEAAAAERLSAAVFARVRQGLREARDAPRPHLAAGSAPFEA